VEERCTEFGDAWGVRQALLNYATATNPVPPYATHAFLPDYEFEDVFDEEARKRVHRQDSYPVPNLALVAGSANCPDCRGGILLTDHDASGPRERAVRLLSRALVTEQQRPAFGGTHFLGFAQARAGEDHPYVSVWQDRQPNYPLWFGSAFVLLIGGSALGVLLARKRAASMSAASGVWVPPGGAAAPASGRAQEAPTAR
jgi:hypothetical protein